MLHKAPHGDGIGRALAFCENGISGAEAYVFLRLEGARLPEGRLFCAEDETGALKRVLFFNGDRAVTAEAGAPPYPDVPLLRYRGPLPEADAGVCVLTNRDTLTFYTLQSPNGLTPGNEARYVYRARAMRDALAAGFGVKINGAPAAFAFIVAQNKNSALIGDVFTLPEHRGRGCAKRTVSAAVRAALLSGRTPYVICEEKMTGFYKNLGFTL